MVRMRILGLSVDSTAKTPILLLQTEDEKRVLPIWIGSMEAMSISLALSGQDSPRPLTHDLLLSLVRLLDASIEALEIISFHDGTFFAEMLLKQGEKSFRVDCRPSDGITLAIKLGTPIFVDANVLDTAINAQQRQDATSFQALKPYAEIEQKKVEPPKKSQKNVQHITIKMPPKAHVKTLTQPTNAHDESMDLEKLLRSLEPPSNKKM